MSQLIAPVGARPAPELPSKLPSPRPKSGRRRKKILGATAACLIVGAVAFFGVRAYRTLMASTTVEIPTARVQRGDISLTINARGELRGQKPELLVAPMMGGNEMHITSLRKPGELVKAGDVVVQFDTTEQDYKLKEAESDLAEAEQHILQAKAQQQADQEEDRYALLKARADLKLAELEARKNPLIPAIAAKQNDLSVTSARVHLAQLEQNLANHQATNNAGVAIQQAGRAKAEAQATTARQNIEAMTLRAHRSGYVSVRPNSSGNFFFFGMTMPLYQAGDAVRPGVAVAEIPDLQNWEINASIAELDRGHLAVGDKVATTVIAVPNHGFTGHIKEIGGTTGPPWERRFSCKVSLDSPSSELRPGMSAQLVITTDQMHQVLWLPAQALFESDGRTFVYARSGGNFTSKDVKLLRRNETRVVISGLAEGQIVALANPAERAKKKSQGGKSAIESMPK